MVQLFYNKGKERKKEREREREKGKKKRRQNKERQTFILDKMQVRIAFCLCPYQGVDYKKQQNSPCSIQVG